MNTLLDTVEEVSVIENVESTLGKFLNLTLTDGAVLRFDAIGEDEFTIEVSEDELEDLRGKLGGV